MATLPDPLSIRQPDHPIEPIFLKRWSPRAMSGEPISQDILNSLFEAARWAPSTYNEQEWRFLYARRDSDHWDTFFNILVEANQTWCRNAGVLILVCSAKTFSRNGKPNPVHSLDTGMAVQNLMLQATTFPQVVTHAMGGFDRGRARTALRLPENYEPECMIAVGIAGDPDQLPEELRAREEVTSRKGIGEIAAEGPFSF
ncbi:MAG: nitroreductase family protein [Planctomycetaceae bacterium]|nr:nitroreductase family protein [Planctomycetaceae bacterium]